ncbi:MAG: chemotaxis response regulator protein-glutamate methylesterase [Gemmatimonadaceae bacterium]
MSSSDSATPTRDRRRVLVVDDSAFMRRLVSDVVQESGEFEVVGTARDGHDALRQVAALDPDLVTLDVDMPGLDGLAALEAIMRTRPRPVVMLRAGGSDGGVDATLRALERGAVDFVRKPSGAISLDLDAVRDQLVQALRAAATVHLSHPTERPRAPVASRGPVVMESGAPLIGGRHTPQPPAAVVCIAASTGGPAALARVVPLLPAWSDVAVLIVQHMPPGFTASFARRLDGQSRLRVAEAVHGEPLRAGHAYVAPGGLHLLVQGSAQAPRIALSEEAPLWGVRPAADLLFRSVAALYGPRALGVVMTGMGCDGAEGLMAVRTAGGGALVQDVASSVIPGMPQAAVRHAGVDAEVPLEELAGAMAAQLEARRAAGWCASA